MKSNEINQDYNENLNQQPKTEIAQPVQNEFSHSPPITQNMQNSNPSWAQKHSDNEILNGNFSMPPPENSKKKTDPVKWIAVSLAAVFAATTVFSVSALGKVKLSGSSLTGTVTSVEGNSITVSVSSATSSGMFSGMPGGMPQGSPPDMQNGNGQNNSQGDSSSSSQEENSDSTGNSSKQQGAPNDMPEGNMGQMPDSNGAMPGDFGNSAGESQNASGEVSVKLGIGTEIKNGTQSIDADDIQVGDSVTITFGALNSAKSVTVNENNQTQGNMPDFNFNDNNSQQDNTGQSDSSNNT